MQLPQIHFEINDQTSVQLEVMHSKQADVYFLHGFFTQLNSTPHPTSSITIDGESPIQGDLAKVTAVFKKIEAAVAQGTGTASLMNKDLTIVTRQWSCDVTESDSHNLPW